MVTDSSSPIAPLFLNEIPGNESVLVIMKPGLHGMFAALCPIGINSMKTGIKTDPVSKVNRFPRNGIFIPEFLTKVSFVRKIISKPIDKFK
jgi:hypothetical protein